MKPRTLEARDREAFVHPGYVSPGILFARANNTRSHDVVLAALAEADSEPLSNPVDLLNYHF